jgi:broad specificity phosphatase PhoE
VQTAEIIANVAARTVTLDQGLIELDFGSFEGRPVRELMLQHGKNSARGLVDMLPTDSEPWADVASRAMRCVSAWLDRHPQDEILFVCHDAVMQSMAQRMTGSFFKNGHGRPFRFTLADGAWRVVEVG